MEYEWDILVNYPHELKELWDINGYMGYISDFLGEVGMIYEIGIPSGNQTPRAPVLALSENMVPQNLLVHHMLPNSNG